MSEVIKFPSASNKSKLSACPTTKIPQATDWIYQDFFNTMLTNDGEYSSIHLAPSVQINELYTNESYLYAAKGQMEMPCQQYLSYTSFTEALHVISEPQGGNDWDNNIDYHFYPTSTDDQVSLPDLDNTKSGDEEEDEEEEEDKEEECDPIGIPADVSRLVNMAPVLIESTISSCTTSTDDIMSSREDILTEPTETTIVQSSTIDQIVLKKRKSTSSFSSLKSFMNVFNTISHKRSKINHLHLDSNTASAVQQQSTSNKNNFIPSSLSKKFFRYFKRRS